MKHRYALAMVCAEARTLAMWKAPEVDRTLGMGCEVATYLENHTWGWEKGEGYREDAWKREALTPEGVAYMSPDVL